MADKVFPDTHTRITADLLRKSRRHMVALGGPVSLVNSSPSADIWQSTGASLTFNNTTHNVGWSTATSPPAWAAVVFSTLAIIEPGMYALQIQFHGGIAPTTKGLFMSANLGFYVFAEQIPIDPLHYGGGGPSTIYSTLDLLTVTAADLASSGHFTISQTVYCPTDATGTVNVTGQVARLLAA